LHLTSSAAFVRVWIAQNALKDRVESTRNVANNLTKSKLTINYTRRETAAKRTGLRVNSLKQLREMSNRLTIPWLCRVYRRCLSLLSLQ